jgi:hypothetical protein
METNLLRQATLDEEVGCSRNSDGCITARDIIRTVNAITVQLKASIIKYEVDASAGLVAKIPDSLPQLIEVVTKNVLLSSSEVITASRLKRFDLFLGHINEQ